ncbi:MAG: hypothetical protein SFU86_02025, partial [Pirellulaceae bacterium]|nr:hypothetical protein [Pirellulaceae bacterium]
LWIPTASVQHYIPPERINLPYLIRFFDGMGKTDFQHEVVEGRVPRTIRRKRRKVARRAITGRIGAAALRLLPMTGNRWVRARLQAARDWAYSEACKQAPARAA